jgi:protein disulfide-isomerase A1
MLFAVLCPVVVRGTVSILFDFFFQTNYLNDIILSFFISGHCKELAPHYDAAAKQLGAKGVLAKVDCTKNEESCRAHDADSYPTLKWFVNGVATPYTKARTQQAIVAFVLEQSRAAQVDLKDVAAADAFIAESLPHSTVAVIALATKSAGSTRTLFGAVAKELREEGFAFAATAVGDEESAQALATHFNVQRTDAEAPMFILQKGFQDAQKQVVYSGELTEKAVAQWARLQSFPVFGEIGPDTHKRYQARGLPLLYFFIDPSDTETRAEIDAAVYAVAPRYLSQVSFVHCDAMTHQGQAETLGVTNTPGVVLHEHKHNHRYLLKGIITERSLTKFLDSWIDKTLPRHLKSQSPPKKQTKSVQVLVGKTFNQVALDDSKDVIVEFFAPWCSECKKFGPIYEKWAKANKDDSKLVVAAIDATANDVDAPGIVFNSYPTIFLLLAGQKSQPIKFSGDRTEKGLTKWLKESREGRDKPKPPPLPEQQQVLQLTDKNWDDMLKQHPHLFVKFYAPWWYIFSSLFLPLIVCLC